MQKSNSYKSIDKLQLAEKITEREEEYNSHSSKVIKTSKESSYLI